MILFLYYYFCVISLRLAFPDFIKIRKKYIWTCYLPFNEHYVVLMLLWIVQSITSVFFLLAGWYMMPWCNGEITHSRIFYLNMHSKLSAKITFQCTKSERCKNWNIFKMQKKIMVKIVQKKKTFAAFLFQYFYRILYWKTIFSL